MRQQIAVIGGGIVGMSTALTLLRRDQSVTLIDPIHPGDPGQTSFGNAGILAREGVGPIATPSDLIEAPKVLTGLGPYYLNWRELPKNLLWIKDFIWTGRASNRPHFAIAMNELLYDTIEQHRAIAAGTSAEQFIKEGLFTFLYKDDRHRAGDALSRQYQNEMGVQFELVRRDSLAKRDPQLSQRYQSGVDFSGHGWITNPSAYLRALFDHFVKSGGVFKQVKVLKIYEDTVALDSGDPLRFDQIVLSAGAWSTKLLDSRVKLPLRAERGYHLHFKNPSHQPPHPYLVMDRRFGFTPMSDGLRAAGNADLSSPDSAPKPRAHQNLLRFVRQLYPSLTYDDYDTWMGSRPTLSDGLPALGRLADHQKIICAFGSQHLGLTMGPKLGTLVADIATSTMPNIDLTPYDPNRFS